jgi:hypothetical protein
MSRGRFKMAKEKEITDEELRKIEEDGIVLSQTESLFFVKGGIQQN